MLALQFCIANATYTPLGYDVSGTSLVKGSNKNYSERDQCTMILFMLKTGLSAFQACENKKGAPIWVSYTTLRRWKIHFDWYGETPWSTAERNKGRELTGRNKMTPSEQRHLKKIVDKNPGLFLDEMQEALKRKFAIKFHVSTIHRRLTTSPVKGGLGYSLKLLTFKAVQASRQQRSLYRARLRQIEDPACFIFVDETNVGKNAGRRRRGWGQKGCPVPQYELFRGDVDPNIENYSMIAAVDINGFVTTPQACRRVFAKRSRNDTDASRGTIDTERFYQWVLGDLVPTLGRTLLNEPRSTVVLDNATIHKDPRIEAAIVAAGAQVIWCAAYSPDLNPIERGFSNYKRYLRRLYKHFHLDQHECHRRALLYSVTPQNMRNFYNGQAMEGCIRNVPTENETTEEEMFCMLLVLGFIKF